MKPLRIGSFDLGCENVVLTVRDGMGGEFITNPIPEIWVGIGTKDWVHVFDTLHHEAMEFASFRTQARFTPDWDVSLSSSAYYFFFDHSKFADICARVSHFMVPALPVLQAAWKDYNKLPCGNNRKCRRSTTK